MSATPEFVQHRLVALLSPWAPTQFALLAVVTNDIFTREDQEFLIKHDILPAERIQAIEAGGCPHPAIREGISTKIGALETLRPKFNCQLPFVENGGTSLTVNYSQELADFIIDVVVVWGLGKVHRIYTTSVYIT
jgi:urease accessory protein